MSQIKYKFPLGELIDWAEHCAKEYYADGNAVLTDDEFDSLKITIHKLCQSQRIDPGTIRILRGIGYVGDENKLKHPVRMYSLDNVFDTLSLSKWLERIYAKLRTDYADLNQLETPLSYGMEYKLDGMSLDLVYRFGRLVSAITRGDGNYGENILSNVLLVDAIPNEIKIHDTAVKIPLLVIHGELYVSKSSLKRFVGLSLWSDIRKPPQNERSAVLSIRNKDFGAMGLQLSFNPHEVASVSIDANEDYVSTIPDELYSDSMYHRLEALKQFGFNRISPLSPPIEHTSIRDLLIRVDSLIPKVEAMRSSEDFDLPIDGLVISVDHLEYRHQIGHTARIPKWAMAYKFPALGQKTQVKHVNWQVTMDGNLIPVVEFDSVDIGGAKITNASLFNYAKFISHDLHSGDMVTVVRRGDVVPMLAEVHVSERADNAVGIQTPTMCPSCGSKLRIVKLHLSCSNTELCQDQIVMRLMRFVGSAGLNIRGFGEYGLRKLVEFNRIQSPVDLYKLHLLQSSSVSGLAWTKVLRAIEQSKSQDFLQVLKALNVPKPKGGYKPIVNQYKDLDAWIDEYLAMSDSGDDSEIVLWVRSNYPMLKELYHLGVGHVNYDYGDGA